jgi:hypothetical protein
MGLIAPDFLYSSLSFVAFAKLKTHPRSDAEASIGKRSR